MKTEFNGKVYPHPMMAERQREITVSITALRMMQKHYNNPYFSFKCVSCDEECEWYVKAEAVVPQVQRVDFFGVTENDRGS